MKKKTYQQPEIKVVELEQTEIICASTEGQILSLDDDNSYEDIFFNE